MSTTHEAPTSDWLEFEVKGPVETQRYRTNSDATRVEFWSERGVPGLSRRGWNRTRSETMRMKAKAAIARATRT